MPRLKCAGKGSGGTTDNRRLEFVVAGCVVSSEKVLLVWHKKHNEWLPPGGHIEQNESPDDAVVREVREETGLDIGFMDRPKSPIKNISRQLATPFFADIHSVGDHDHCCFYYLMRLTDGKQSVTLNLREVDKSQWFSRSELTTKYVPGDVGQICRIALDRSGTILMVASERNSEVM